MKNDTQKNNSADRPTTYKATIEVSATETAFGRRCHIDLDTEQTAEVQAFADQCGMTFDAFVRSYVSGHGRGTPRPVDYDHPPKVKIEGVVFVVTRTQKHRRRLERAAALFGQTVEQFTSESVNNSIVGAEDCMLVNPKTGELLGEDNLGKLLRGDETFTEPTLQQQRGEDTRFPWLRPGQKPSRLSVLLDPQTSAIARNYMESEADSKHAWPECIEDLVSAAVEYFCDDTDQGTSTVEYVERAKARRLGIEPESADAQEQKGGAQ